MSVSASSFIFLFISAQTFGSVVTLVVCWIRTKQSGIAVENGYNYGDSAAVQHFIKGRYTLDVFTGGVHGL